MIIRGITIRSKLIITTLITVGIMVVLSLVIMDTSSRLSQHRELLKEQSSMITRMRALEHSFYSLVREENPRLRASCIEEAHLLGTGISGLMDFPTVAREEGLLLYGRQIRSSTAIFVNILSDPTHTVDPGWSRAETELLVLGDLVSKFSDAISSSEENFSRNQHRHLAIILALGICSTALLLGILTFNLSGSFSTLISYTRKIRKGGLPPPLNFPPGDEMGQLADHLNMHASDMREKIQYINSLTGEGPVSIYTPDDEDELGNALVILSNYLTRKEMDEVSRNREDKKQNWISAGNAQIGEVLRSERENVVTLSFSIIQKLVTYMNVEMGSLFISDYSDPDHPILELTASYAYDRRKYITKTLEWGAGLPGTCAQEKKRILLTEVPDHYFEVTSGTGSARPNCLLLVPMMIDDRVYGIIELATIRLLRPFEIEFLESQAEGIASSLKAVQTNERTKELLKQSRAQAEAMKKQEAIMLDNMKQLEEAQSDSGRKESEITGILDAINRSTLVAELGLNGRYTRINDQFLKLLESQSDQVLGKLHSEFSQADPSSDEYKAFWISLRNGESISNTERYKLFSGKEIWLRQTFTPIIDREGQVYKILNLAEDITETRVLQERLKSREHVITRTGLDLQTLNEAVNTALIKCELDPDGIIMQVNEKYTEITGYGRKELLGRNYRLFLRDTEKEQFEKIWKEVAKQKVYEGVIRRSRPTGEEAWLVSTFSPVVDESGVIYKVYFMGFDITEKKLKYQLLEDANQEIERLKQQLKDYQTG
ncbi:MAG: PAS domain-containing protein [Bacteroidales bacterium]